MTVRDSAPTSPLPFDRRIRPQRARRTRRTQRKCGQKPDPEFVFLCGFCVLCGLCGFESIAGMAPDCARSLHPSSPSAPGAPWTGWERGVDHCKLQIEKCKLPNEVGFRGRVGLAFGGWDRKLPALQGSLKGRTWIKSDCIGKTRRRKPSVT